VEVCVCLLLQGPEERVRNETNTNSRNLQQEKLSLQQSAKAVYMYLKIISYTLLNPTIFFSGSCRATERRACRVGKTCMARGR
jgi:hypothetical protein